VIATVVLLSSRNADSSSFLLPSGSLDGIVAVSTPKYEPDLGAPENAYLSLIVTIRENMSTGSEFLLRFRPIPAITSTPPLPPLLLRDAGTLDVYALDKEAP
jgi:hypothetical protein